MHTTTLVADVLLARAVREEVRDELRTRMLPSLLRFLDDEVTTIESIECTDPSQKAQLDRLVTDLTVIRQSLESFVATSVALLQDR